MSSFLHTITHGVATFFFGIAAWFGIATSTPVVPISIPAAPPSEATSTATAPALQHQQTSPYPLSNNNDYVNSYGNTVHSPAYSNDGSVPTGATAQCVDGSYSFSQHRNGTCSYHGGVATWLSEPDSQSQMAYCQTEAQTEKQNYLALEIQQIGASPQYQTESYAQFLQRLQKTIASATPESVASTIQFETQAYEWASAETEQKKENALNYAYELAQLKYNSVYANCMDQ